MVRYLAPSKMMLKKFSNSMYIKLINLYKSINQASTIIYSAFFLSNPNFLDNDKNYM